MLVFKELNLSSFSWGRGTKFSPLPVDLHSKGRFQSLHRRRSNCGKRVQ